MKIVVAMTGASGNMGRECLRQVLEIPEVEKVKILVRKTVKTELLSRVRKDSTENAYSRYTATLRTEQVATNS